MQFVCQQAARIIFARQRKSRSMYDFLKHFLQVDQQKIHPPAKTYWATQGGRLRLLQQGKYWIPLWVVNGG
jgi:hypothetical protein